MKGASDRICPRCGYDLTGVIDAWERSCPLRGVCSECGQRFDWFEIFHPDHNDLRGFIEHAPLADSTPRLIAGRLGFLRRAWRTWAWTLLPGRFWGRVGVHHRLVPGAMITWLLILLLPLHAAAAVLSMALTRLHELLYFTVGASDLRYLSSWTYPLAVFDSWGGTSPRLLIGDWPVYVLPALALHAAVTATLLLLARTRRDAKLRPGHIGRAFVYGLSWLVLLAAFRMVRNVFAVAEEFMNWQGGGPAPPPTRTFGGLTFRPAPTPVEPMYLATVAPGLIGTVLFIWLALWWWRAIRQGWELRLGGVVWALLMIVGALAAANVWVLYYAG